MSSGALVSLHGCDWRCARAGLRVILLDQALSELAVLDPRQAQIVELRYLPSFSEQDVARCCPSRVQP